MREREADLFARLEKAITDWKGQITQAHNRLLEQIAKTRQQIESSPDVADVASQLTEALRERDQARSALDSLRDDLTRLQAELNAKAAASELEEELAQALRERDAARDEADQLRAQLKAATPSAELQERLAKATRERNAALERIQELEGQLEGQLAAPQEPGAAPGRQPEAERARRLKFQVFNAEGKRLPLGEILLKAGVITEEQLADALAMQADSPHQKFGSLLIEKGYADEGVIAQVLASQLGVPLVHSVDEAGIDEEAVHLLSPRVARRHHCIPLRSTEEEIVLVMSNPLDLVAIDDVEHATARRVAVVVAAESEITKALERFYGTETSTWF